ncbi:hypothetical protein C6536_26540 [Escherichia coli]|nr:hypothetical protein [Escherichia coli]NYY37379.1 hypothetical protein [Escherichia coli]
MTDFRGKTSIFSHPVYLFLRKFSLQDSRGGSASLIAGFFISEFHRASHAHITSPSLSES